ncbi:MAG TPA: VIT family protein [Methylocella sp.]|nr:VIT family protein [Methylocella sp.]
MTFRSPAIRRHRERHAVERIGWLRAAVLGANDGIISTASLIAGVAAASPSRGDILLSGVAALVAGSMSMAAGEYVSVSSQADSEAAELNRERRELADDVIYEVDELTQIYVARGVEPDLARNVAIQLMEKDALGAHARDELGITDIVSARPLQAAFASAVTFASGAALPLLAALLAPKTSILPAVFGISIVVLAGLGALGARLGGAEIFKPALRVSFWGALAIFMTAGIGSLIGRSL